MKYIIEVPDYEHFLKLTWAPDFRIECKEDHDAFLIRANKDGLISLANHLLTLAQDGVPSGSHIHLDPHNPLEDGSSELILVRWEEWEDL